MKIHYLDPNAKHLSFERPLCGRFWTKNRPKTSTKIDEIDCGLCLRLMNGYTTTSTHNPMKL